MKTALNLVLLLNTAIASFAQCYDRLPDTGVNTNRPSAWPYFANYTTEQKQLIKDNWKQYFKSDINEDLNPDVNMFPVKFDSYGALYPHQDFFAKFKDSKNRNDFNPRNLSSKNTLAYSLFDMFFYGDEKLIASAIDRQSDTQTRDFYHKLYTTGFNKNKDFNGQFEKFYTEWHNFHVNRKIAELKNEIRIRNIKKVLFFIHGYNVPYSLAVVQAIELHKLIQKQGVDTDELLLVPVFWPSNDAKALNIESEATFTTANEKSFKNGLTSTYYSNRAYFAAAGLRMLVNGLQSENVKVYMFSHSLGATTLTTTQIDTYSKFQFGKKKLKPAPDAKTFLEKNEDKLDDISAEILYRLTTNNPVPSMPVRSFMSAPAIPGVSTFCDMDKTLIANKKFYVAINRNDEMLNKRFQVKFRPSKRGSTTLGMDYKGEACETKALFTGPLKDNFIVREVSNKEDHDILIYMLQPGFQNFVGEFLNDK